MQVVLTGCAGFIGSQVAKKLLERGDHVVGIDNLNDYYDVNLKRARLTQLQSKRTFKFYEGNIADARFISDLFLKYPETTHIVHLAAQAGVRYSLIEPFSYGHSNIIGHLTMIESARRLKNLQHLVFASSSSVYGGNHKLPFAVEDSVDEPISLYAASKRSCELMSYCYTHLYQIPQTGLRYFSVYGPWGRPDMAAFLFTKGIINGDDITVYNNGEMRRNFTYIDDVVEGTINCMEHPPITPLFQLYNIGNTHSEHLMDFIHTLENVLGKKAQICFEPIQPGDVKDAIADIETSQRDFGFHPKININEGLQNFVHWYRDYYSV